MLRRSRVLWFMVVVEMLVAGVIPMPAISAAAATAGVPSACALLSPGDLQSVLHGTVGAGDLTTAPNGGETICGWAVVTSANGSGYGAQLDVKTPFTSKDFKRQRQIASGPTQTVKHLGDAAFSERAKVGGQVFDDLWVHKGKLAFRLEVLKDLGSKPLARLAPRVLANLASGMEHP